MFTADIEHTALATITRHLDALDPSDFAVIKSGLAAEVAERLARDGYRPECRQLLWEADLRR